MKLIDKDVLVAEINKRIIDAPVNNIGHQRVWAYNDVKDIINTLEVKEVDLEEEIKEVQRDYKTIEEYEGYPCTMFANGIEWIARHFFELGMAVSNKAQKGEKV